MATFRQALSKPFSWFRQQPRSYLLGFLAWNDRHGSYLDEDLEEGMEPLTKAEALAMIRMALDEGEVASLPRKNPKKKTRKRNPADEGMLMGQLVSVEVKTPKGKKTIRFSGKYLGYLPKGKHLCIMKKTSKKAGKNVSFGVNSLHNRFHNCGPSKVTVFEWPDIVGRRTDVGRIVALTYKIPAGLRSPEKNKYLWHHEFGDHGERGHGPVSSRGAGNYPTKFMPMLQRDQAGNYYIKRMPGNKFYVTDWLYW